MKRRRRFLLARTLLAGLGVLIAVMVAGAAWRGWEADERARLLRHQLIAERIFDGMERELTTLLDDEESRPFIQYRPMQALMGPRPDHVLGWFQIDPEGTFSVTHDLDEPSRSDLSRIAQGLSGWGHGDAQPPTTVTVTVPVDVPRAKVAAAAPVKVATAVPQKPVVMDNLPDADLPLEASLNNSAAPRSNRFAQRQSVNQMQLQEFAQTAVAEPQAPETQAPAPEPQTAPAPPAVQARGPTRVWVPVQVEVPASAEVIDVVLSPMALRVEGVEPRLVLHRTVSLNERTWVQGLVLRVPELQAHLVRRSLADTGLQGAVTVRWDGATPPETGYLFRHDFAAPFDTFTASTHIETLPEPTGVGRWVWVILFALLVLAAAGLMAIDQVLRLMARHAEQREDFVSAVTHELKSPLTSIRMYSEMLEGNMVSQPEQRQGYYKTIRLEAERLSRLVDDVLAFSQLDRGLPVAQGQTGKLGSVIQDVARMMDPQFEAAGATLALHIDQDVTELPVDRDALSQVLTNLLDNALKFSKDAENRTVALRVQAEADRAVLTVRDRGPGVPPALLKTMFRPFVRGERELTRRTQGTGIGLALVKELIEQLGGTVRASNHPDGGLHVAVSLPRSTT
ncbi:MAG: ATP-binding protein [Myxococcota bacterium]